MVTDADYNAIADDVYSVDSQKISKPYQVGDPVAGGKYKILKTEDNTSNGMQAMAVAPVDKNGNVDTSQVVIAYAGTNFSDLKDIQTDMQSIGFGSKKLHTVETTPLPPEGGWIANENPAKKEVKKSIITDAQQITAVKFAKEIEQQYPQAKITTAGHSLGESLAMYVALKRGYSNIGFNGPDIHNLISKEEIAYMQQHPEQFRNYRHWYDLIGNIMGDETKTAIYAIL